VAPKSAAIYYQSLDTEAARTFVSKFDAAVVGFSPHAGRTKIHAAINSIRSKNPAIKLAQYANVIEMQDYSTTTSPYYSLWNEINVNGWWLRDAAGQRVRWSTAYGSYDINVTGWTAPNLLGQRYPQARAKHLRDWVTGYFAEVGLDYIFVDQFNPEPLSDGDFRRIGTVQSRKDAVIASEHRKGVASFVSELRRLNSNVKVMANGLDMSSIEYKGILDGQARECLIGKSWSYETWNTWEFMMGTYRSVFANLRANPLVIFNVCGATRDPALMRYGLASAMMHDGYYSFTDHNAMNYERFDEQLAPVGTAVEAPPAAPHASGVWVRRFQNGIALVNPSKTATLTIDIGPGYKNHLGTVDTVVNNGQPAQVITLAPRSGRVLVKQ
jgi:hypothetical protein